MLAEAIRRCADGKRPFPIFRGDATAKALREMVRFQGRPPAGPEEWRRVLETLNLIHESSSLVARWNQLAKEVGAGPIEDEWPEGMRANARVADSFQRILAFSQDEAPAIDAAVQALFADPRPFDDWWRQPDKRNSLRRCLKVHLQHYNSKSAALQRDRLVGLIESRRGPIYDIARTFLKETLGNVDTGVSDAASQWQDISEQLFRLSALSTDFQTIREATQAIDAAGAPMWAHRLRTEPVRGQDPLTPDQWRSTWEWAWGRHYLQQIDGRGALKKLAEQRRTLEANLFRATEQLVEQRTWLALKSRLTQSVSAALSAYLAAITRIGRGTGVRAAGHRGDARKAMTKAQSAIPVWIMPHWRVSETIPPELGVFDLVIVDEASQSDAWAIPAIVRAKKMLIVGDDKQVSPSDVGVREDDNQQMRRKYLRELPYGQHLLPGSSIYDLGSTMFSADVIRLREHFRCVEPIIQYSNKEFYDREIIPLRIPRPSQRLDPPLIDVFVRGGYRDGAARSIGQRLARLLRKFG